MEFVRHPTEIFTAVYAIPQPIYVKIHQNVFHIRGISRFRNAKQLKRASTGQPNKMYGRNLPHFVFVFSAIAPNIGSLTASHTLAIIIMQEMSDGASPTTSV